MALRASQFRGQCAEQGCEHQDSIIIARSHLGQNDGTLPARCGQPKARRNRFAWRNQLHSNVTIHIFQHRKSRPPIMEVGSRFGRGLCVGLMSPRLVELPGKFRNLLTDLH